MSQVKEYHFEQFQTIHWTDLEHMANSVCGCGRKGCGREFSATDPPEIAVRCHTGSPLYAAYWQDWLYLSCAVCGEPVGKIEVKRSLL